MRNIVLLLVCCLAVFQTGSYAQTCAAPESQQCDSITCGINIQAKYDANNTACRYCSQDDIGARFSSCGSDGNKLLFFFWRPPATCRPSPVNPISLPEPIVVPCNFSCAASEVFSTVDRKCTACPGGTFSSSSMLQYSTFNGLLPGFKTYCEKEVFARQGCNSWRMQNTHIDSGDNLNNNYIRSMFTYDFEVSGNSNAFLSFEYQVDAERGYDYFAFMVNWQILVARSSAPSWTFFRYNFTTPGYYTATWMYYKDELVTFGADMAKVRNIVLSGAQSFGTVCKSCPPGTFANATKLGCQSCSAGTFADVERSTVCKSCPTGQSSFDAATFCFPSSFPCTENDYAYTYTPCVNGMQNKTAQWIVPTLCNVSLGATALPPSSTVACSPCKPGQHFVNNECQYCPEGERSDGTACSKCSATNQVPGDKIHYVTLDASAFRTSCSGECRSKWRFYAPNMDSGVGNGVSETVLEYDALVSPVRDSSAVVAYTLSCPSNGSVDFIVNNALAMTVPCQGCAPISMQTTLPLGLNMNVTTIKIIFKSKTRSYDPAASYSCNIMRVQNITINGGSVGGSSSCINCPAGTYNDGGLNCLECQPGTFQDQPQQRNCSICPAESFSALSKSTSCLPCGNGTTTKGIIGQSGCVWDYAPCATINSDGRVFNWSSLATAYYSTPFPDPDGTDAKIYLNLCRSQSHPYCKTIMCKVQRSGFVQELGGQYSVQSIGSSTGVRLFLQNLQNGCTTNIEMLCRTSIEQKEREPVIVQEVGCKYRVSLYKDAACPTCNKDDYVPFQGACIGNQRIEGYYKRITCYGGSAAPSPTVTIPCSPYEVTFPYWLIAVLVILGLIVLLVAAFVTICLCIRNRKLYQQLHDKPNSPDVAASPETSVETVL